MRLVWIAAAVVVGIPAAMALVGVWLPRGRKVSRTVRLAAGPAAVWAVMSDLGAVASWWAYLSSVERRPDREGREVWLERRANGWSLPLETVERVEGKRLVRRAVDAGLRFGGEWIYEVEAAPEGGSVVTVTECGEIKSPVLRVLARLGDRRAGIDSYLKALARRLGEEIRLPGR